MKKFLLSFLALFAACLSFTANAENYTFDFKAYDYGLTRNASSSYITSATLTNNSSYGNGDGNLTIKLSKKSGSGFRLMTGGLRPYRANSSTAGEAYLDLSAKDGYIITQITITNAKSNNFQIGNDKALSAISGKWTGTESSIRITYKPTENIDIEKIEVVYSRALTEGKLAFAEASYETTIGDEFVSPQPNTWEVGEGATISYTSSDTNVADVDNNGMLTIKGAGTTTITVNATETETHTAATASYTLTVKAPAEPVEANFSIAGVKDGVITIEVNEEGLGVAEFFYTPANIDSSKLTPIDVDEDSVLLIPNEEVANKLDFLALSIGEYPVKIHFDGDEIYNGFDYIFTVNVVKKALNITFTPAEVVVALDGTAETPVASPALDNIKYEKVFNVTENRDATEDEIAVDKSGIIAAAIGEYIVTATSEGNDIYNPGEGTFKITVEPKTQELLLDKKQYEVSKLNEPVEIVYACEDGAVVKFEASPAEGITFDGNTFTVTSYGNYTVTATATAPNYKDATATFTVIAENPFGTKREVYTDVLDYQFLLGTTKEGTTYVTKTNLKSAESGITYSAMLQPTKNTNGTQYYSIRTDKSTSGIVVTANEKGLVFKGIKVHFASACTQDRTIDVYYASDETAFKNPSELYDTSSNTKEITTYSTSLTRSDKDIAETHEMIPGVEVTAEKNHQFIGIRSNKNAIQISKIEITWETVQPELTFAEAADFEIDHNFQPYEELSGKHHAEHAIEGIQLYEEKYHEAVKATITHDEAAWDFAGRYTAVPDNLTAEEAEAFHKEHHYDFFVAPEISEFNTNFVKFNASHAGKYLLTLDVKDEYKDYLDCTPKTYVINVKPNFSTSDFTVDSSLGFAPDAMNELRLFVTKEENGEVNGYNVAVYTDKGWQLSSNHDLSQVFIDARYRNLYYQIENKEDNSAKPEFRPAAKAEAQAIPEGYIHYDAKKGFDLSNAKSLSLIAVENGVQSAPATFAFNEDKTETAVEEIESENLETEYYSIEGIRVETPLAPGIYVARRGAEAKVIMVK